MFSAKFSSSMRDVDIDKTIKNITTYICNDVNFENTRVVSDKTSTEIVAGKEESGDDNQVVVELVIRKNIVINNFEFRDRSALDRHIKKIKHFCEQAKSIEDLKYLPINME